MSSHTFTNRALFIAKDIAAASTTILGLVAGEVVILDKNFNIMVAGTTFQDSEKFYIVEGSGDALAPIRHMQEVDGSLIHRWAGLDRVLKTEQVSYIGSNGATGAITVANNARYTITFTMTWDEDIYSKRPDRQVLEYYSDATATQQEIADAFVTKINANPHLFKYMVAAVVTTGADRGISLTARALPFDKFGYKLDQVSFDVMLNFEGTFAGTQLDQSGFLYGTTTAGASTNASKGSGYYIDLWYQEIKMLGSEGHLNLTQHPVLVNWGEGRATAAVEYYDIYTIDHSYKRVVDSAPTGFYGGFSHAAIAVVPGSALQLRLEAVLNPYMATVPIPQVAVSL